MKLKLDHKSKFYQFDSEISRSEINFVLTRPQTLVKRPTIVIERGFYSKPSLNILLINHQMYVILEFGILSKEDTHF